MQAAKKPGVIINMGSSAGLYPMYRDPVYSASKGLMFVPHYVSHFIWGTHSDYLLFIWCQLEKEREQHMHKYLFIK